MLANDDCHPGMNAEAFNAYSEVLFRYFYGERLNYRNTPADYQAASTRLDALQTDCEIEVGQTVTGRIDHNGLLSNRYSGDVLVGGDIDFFAVELTAETVYRFELENRPRGAHHKPEFLGLYSLNGGELTDQGNFLPGDRPYSEYTEYDAPYTGTVYIGVYVPTSRGPFNTGLYWLTVTEVP